MSRSKTRWAGLALVATSLLIGLALREDPSSPPPQQPPPAARPAAVNPQTLARMEAQAARTASERLAQLPEPVVPQEVGGFSREELAKVSGVFREMLAVQGLYNQRLS